jgi:hypothetical protein
MRHDELRRHVLQRDEGVARNARNGNGPPLKRVPPRRWRDGKRKHHRHQHRHERDARQPRGPGVHHFEEIKLRRVRRDLPDGRAAERE